MTAYAHISYGGGEAKFWGNFTQETVEREFMRYANQCFGIRKSIMAFHVNSFIEEQPLPEPWDKFEGAQVVLKHTGGDTIVWGSDPDTKLKSEWD